MKLLKNKKNLFNSVLFFMTAILVISVVDTICKFFTKELHAIQIVWGYFIGINLTLWVFFFLKGEKLSKLMMTNKPILQILRPSFLLLSNQFSNFYENLSMKFTTKSYVVRVQYFLNCRGICDINLAI